MTLSDADDCFMRYSVAYTLRKFFFLGMRWTRPCLLKFLMIFFAAEYLMPVALAASFIVRSLYTKLMSC